MYINYQPTGGDLSAIIQRCRSESRLIPEDIVWNILTQLVLALHECHFNQQSQVAILHRDIKPEVQRDCEVSLIISSSARMYFWMPIKM